LKSLIPSSLASSVRPSKPAAEIGRPAQYITAEPWRMPDS
jgi:hypothetical protein